MITEPNQHLLETKINEQKNIYIIGTGIYGCHTALELAKKGYKVVLLEKNSELFSELSGKYGVRIHQGPHYLRSPTTRKACREGYEEFTQTYPELVNEHEYSIYALGALKDQSGADTKVTATEFESIFNKEYKGHEDINLAEYGYQGLHSAKKLEESSMAGGAKLREYFTAELLKYGVTIRCNVNITSIEPQVNGQVKVNVDDHEELADHVVNATSFKAFLPPSEDPLPLKMEIRYQCTVILLYDDLSPKYDKPFSFIVMDGAYPCIMPYIGRLETAKEDKAPKYMLYHATHTIRGTFDTYEEAQLFCNSLTDKNIETISEENLLAGETETLKEQFEKEINRFYPGFAERFKYRGWHAATLAKIRSDREFRTTVTFERKGITYVFPGKVNDIFKVAREVEALIENKNILCIGNYRYIQGGVLDVGKVEIAEKPSSRFFNTCDLRRNPRLPNSTCGIKPFNSSPTFTNYDTGYFNPSLQNENSNKKQKNKENPVSFTFNNFNSQPILGDINKKRFKLTSPPHFCRDRNRIQSGIMHFKLRKRTSAIINHDKRDFNPSFQNGNSNTKQKNERVKLTSPSHFCRDRNRIQSGIMRFKLRKLQVNSKGKYQHQPLSRLIPFYSQPNLNVKQLVADITPNFPANLNGITRN